MSREKNDHYCCESCKAELVYVKGCASFLQKKL